MKENLVAVTEAKNNKDYINYYIKVPKGQRLFGGEICELYTRQEQAMKDLENMRF